MIRNINSYNDYDNVGAWCNKLRKYFCCTFPKKEVKERSPTLGKRCFVYSKENWEKDTLLSDFGFRSVKTQKHFTTFLHMLKNCWVTLLHCLFTFHPFIFLQIIKKYVGRRITLLKRKQIYRAVIRYDGISRQDYSLLLSLLLGDVLHAPHFKHASREVFNFVMTAYNLT